MTISTQWQLARDAAERYEQILVPAILGPAAQALVERSALRDGEVVLDVGCGTGAATRFAAETVGLSGRAVGVDVNAGMIAVARSLPPVRGAAIEWFEKSAHDLPFAEEEFDVVLCAQTLQFLDDRPRALAEMCRVLKPGGRVAVSLWCDVQESPYFYALVQAVTRYIDAQTATGLGAAFSLCDLAAIRSLLAEAGFENIQAMVQQFDVELPSLSDFVPRHVSATPMAPGFNAATVEARQVVVQAVSEELASYETGSGVRIPFRTYLVQALK